MFAGKYMPLPGIVYTRSKYNNKRRSILMSMGCCMLKNSCFSRLTLRTQRDFVMRMERSCYNTAIDKATEQNVIPSWFIEEFVDIYSVLCAKILSNIDPDGITQNDYLVPAIVTEQIDIDKIAQLKSMDLLPKKYEQIQKVIEISRNQEIDISYTDMYTCSRCGHNKCKEKNRYNRSLDEGVNKRIECIKCGKFWNA